jgi:hypothetical protein
LKYYYKGNSPLFSWPKELISDESALSDHLRKISEEHDHVWLVTIRHWEADTEWRVKTALNDKFTLVQQQQFPGVNIFAYRFE